MLATHALYPIIKAFCSQAGVEMELKDISVAGRVLALLLGRPLGYCLYVRPVGLKRIIFRNNPKP